MESARATAELQVSDAGLGVQAGWCEALAGRLADNSAPTDAGSGLLAGSTAVNAAHAQLTAAAIRCTFRMQATATKLAVGSIGYAENQASSAAQLWALGQEAVC
jgi:hypothetical protein